MSIYNLTNLQFPQILYQKVVYSSLHNAMRQEGKKRLMMQRRMQRGSYRCKDKIFMVKSCYKYFGGGLLCILMKVSI